MIEFSLNITEVDSDLPAHVGRWFVLSRASEALIESAITTRAEPRRLYIFFCAKLIP